MKNNKKLEKAFILLDDGTIFFGKALGVKGSAFGELCFNTGMTGYQEIFTDPSYYGQLMVTTNAHIGNYGVSEIDIESNSPKIAGLICKNFNTSYSRPAANNSLQNLFIEHNIVAISDVDTRALVSHIRDNGAMNAVISTDIKGSGVPWVNKHMESGIICKPKSSEKLAEAINTLVADDLLLEKLACGAKNRFSSKFTKDHMVDKIVDIYNGMV